MQSMLTTRCPHCHAVFRIRPEQLSVRGGRVRCGKCQQAFSALEHLEEMAGDDVQTPETAQTPVAVAPKPVVAPKPASPTVAAHPPAAMPPKAVPPSVAAPKVAPAPVATPAPAPAPRAKPNAADFIAKAPVPLASDWPERSTGVAFPPIEQVPLFKPDGVDSVPDHAPASVSKVERSQPAADDEFSMDVSFDIGPESVPADDVDDMDFDFSALGEEEKPAPAASPAKPYQSEIGKALCVAAYEPSQELDFGQTVMLEEPIEVTGLRNVNPDADSMFFEADQAPVARVRTEKRKPRAAWPWALGSVLLLGLAGLFLSFIFRVELARAAPDLRPHLESACALLGYSVPYPQDAELISLEGHSFNPETGSEGKFRLVVTLLNKAPHSQAWPHLELTVTDRFDIAVVRRVLTPAEWLPVAYARQPAFDGHSEVTANLPLAINNQQAAGYRLYVFYP
jgi:predicted Zn finger-like uncharacterized protein